MEYQDWLSDVDCQRRQVPLALVPFVRKRKGTIDGEQGASLRPRSHGAVLYRKRAFSCTLDYGECYLLNL
jgi:hypothetical protein